MNIGDQVKVTDGEFKGLVGIIKARHMNPIPNEMINMKAGIILTSRDNETLYGVLLEGDREIIYFPKSCLELLSD